jgi:UDP-N-acetylmuramate dehydrogenase
MTDNRTQKQLNTKTQLIELLKYLKNQELEFRLNEPLAKHTTMGVGGKCSLMLFPKTTNDILDTLPLLNKLKLKFFILGGGSNIIFSEKKLHAVVIKMKNLQNIIKTNTTVVADAGTPMGKVLSFCQKNGLSGLEFTAGVPSTVGGATVMNFGSYGKCLGDFAEEITIINNQGKILTIPREKLNFSYRHNRLSKNHIILKTKFKMKPESPLKIKKTISEFIAKRKKTQPLESKNSGCIFKNKNGFSSGKLIEEAGLKNLRIGDAGISAKHANFIVNLGHATSSNVLALIKKVQRSVLKKFGILLEPEVRIIE